MSVFKDFNTDNSNIKYPIICVLPVDTSWSKWWVKSMVSFLHSIGLARGTLQKRVNKVYINIEWIKSDRQIIHNMIDAISLSPWYSFLMSLNSFEITNNLKVLGNCIYIACSNDNLDPGKTFLQSHYENQCCLTTF